MVLAKIFLRRLTRCVPRFTRGIPLYYEYGIERLAFLECVFESIPSERLLRVTLPGSRALKWPWPAVRFMIFPVRVFQMRLAVPLCVLIFGIYKKEVREDYITLAGFCHYCGDHTPLLRDRIRGNGPQSLDKLTN